MNTQARVGAGLKDVRLEYGLTQRAIAKFIRCHHSTISAIEVGRAGSLKLAEAYAWALGLELRDVKFQGKPSSITRARSTRSIKVSSHKWTKLRLVG